METSGGWRRSQASRQRTRTVRPPRVLGSSLAFLAVTKQPPPGIEEIRRQVTSLASRGFGQGTRSRSEAQKSASRGRRGTTERGS